MTSDPKTAPDPGDPKAAPDELELVRAFVNTLQVDEGTEELSSTRALTDWLSLHGLMGSGTRARRDDLKRALTLREAIRASLFAHTLELSAPTEAVAAIDATSVRARLHPRLHVDGTSTLEPGATGVDAALGRLVAIIHRAAAAGTWPRLKACQDETCQWAFYDHTKNRSGAWCSMRVCGNRAKARAYRKRRGSGG